VRLGSGDINIILCITKRVCSLVWFESWSHNSVVFGNFCIHKGEVFYGSAELPGPVVIGYGATRLKTRVSVRGVQHDDRVQPDTTSGDDKMDCRGRKNNNHSPKSG